MSNAPKKRWVVDKRLLLPIFVFVILLLVAGGVGLAFLLPRDGHFARGVVVAGVDVGGLTVAEAKGQVTPVLQTRLAQEVTWRYEERSWRFTLAELGMVFDLEAALEEAMRVGREGGVFERVGNLLRTARGSLRVEPSLVLAQEAAGEAMVRLAEEVRRKPQDAYLTLNGDEVVIHPQKTGTELDVESCLRQLQEIVGDGQSGDYPLPVKVEQPRVTASDLEAFGCVLGGYSTSFASSSRDRAHNIATAADALNGTLIGPGETFSFNKVVGPRSNETGYKTAPIYSGGKVVPGIGGGVCQVSSTTYNAFLLAGFDIVQRSNHAMPVHYLPAGRDATVVYGVIDLKVRNPFPNSTYLLAGVSGKTLWIKVLGSKTDKAEVSVSSEETGTIPFSIIEKEDPSLSSGKKKVEQKGSNGKKSVTYRTVTRPGQPKKVEVVSRDSYRPMNKIILVAPKAPKQEPPAPPEEETPSVAKAEGGEKAATPPVGKTGESKAKGQ